MKYFYIDVPNHYPYIWSSKIQDVCKSLEFEYGFKKVRFIVNCLAKVTAGDLYRVELADDDCPEFFILRTKFKIIPREQIPDNIIKRYCND